jgi:hypothetical protein
MGEETAESADRLTGNNLMEKPKREWSRPIFELSESSREGFTYGMNLTVMLSCRHDRDYRTEQAQSLAAEKLFGFVGESTVDHGDHQCHA